MDATNINIESSIKKSDMNNLKLILSYLLILICLLFTSCKKLGLCKDEKLTLARTDYSKNILDINGFYYGNPDTAWDKVIRFQTMIFYRNGILFLPGTTEFDKMENYIESVAKSDLLQITKYVWGVFNIQDSVLILEYWQPAQCGYPMIRNIGKILNDSTFIITHRERIRGNDKESANINIVFNLRKYGIKPDSTQNFVK